MKSIERDLIRAIGNNNMRRAKECAKVFLTENKTKADGPFCNQMLELLTKSENNLFELPANVSSILIVDDVAVSFSPKRYFLSDREKKVFDEIYKINKVAEKLSEMKIKYVNSTMLYGESGTGKTTFGRFVAYMLGMPFVYLNLSMVVDCLLGGTQKNITKAFEFIKTQKCVFMLDEIDAVGMKRGNSKDVTEISRVVISLMQNIDTLPNDVVLLGGTNRIDTLDEALLRRFSIKHEVERPKESEKIQIVRKLLNDVGYECSDEDLKRLVVNSKTQAEITNNTISFIAEKVLEKMDGKTEVSENDIRKSH